ncbi:MAG TPA: hypothetical protein VFN74_23170 [Chloroflexota bacterium]|nr:hypothetical protein [Chloroflexota bacterium]
MKLADLLKNQPQGTAAAAPGSPRAAQGPAPGSDEHLRRAATEVLRIFDTGVGNGGITAEDWLMAMAELRAALGKTLEPR